MSLLPQQEKALKHLLRWKVGALFMEPGTGKTRVAVELANAVSGADLYVWIGPLRTIRPEGGVSSVCDEVRRWGGFKAPARYCGVESIGCSDRIYHETRSFISEARCPVIIVDESLKIKNVGAQRTKRLLDLGRLAQYKIILNGTPLSKNLLDLWAQMQFLSPSILGMSLNEFKNTFCNYTRVTKKIHGRAPIIREFITGYENIDYLYSLIRHYVYECDLSLNISQNFREVRYEIGEQEKEEYTRLKEKYLDSDVLLWKNNNIFLEMTNKMQHSYCCTESKFEALDGIFRTVPQSRAIIFCKYISSREECTKRYPLALVLSYQKESLGLNLQDRNHTIYFDKIWDMALRTQAGHRTFRVGQEYECIYYDLSGDVGLERLIDENIRKKVSMSEYFKSKNINEIRKDL